MFLHKLFHQQVVIPGVFPKQFVQLIGCVMAGQQRERSIPYRHQRTFDFCNLKTVAVEENAAAFLQVVDHFLTGKLLLSGLDKERHASFLRLCLHACSRSEQGEGSSFESIHVSVNVHQPLVLFISLIQLGEGQAHGVQNPVQLRGALQHPGGALRGVLILVGVEERGMCSSQPKELNHPPGQLPHFKAGNLVDVLLGQESAGKHQFLHPFGILVPVQLVFHIAATEGDALAVVVQKTVVGVGDGMTVPHDAKLIFEVLCLLLGGVPMNHEGIGGQPPIGGGTSSSQNCFCDFILSDKNSSLSGCKAGHGVRPPLIVQVLHPLQQSVRLMEMPVQECFVLLIDGQKTVHLSTNLPQAAEVLQFLRNPCGALRKATAEQLFLHEKGKGMFPVVVLMEIPDLLRHIQELPVNGLTHHHFRLVEAVLQQRTDAVCCLFPCEK